MRARSVVVLLGLLLGAYVVAAPYITVHRIQAAAESRDGGALAEYIDFPSVRQGLKDQINAAFLKEMTRDDGTKDNGAAALGALFAGVIVDRLAEGLIEAYVTPAGITQLMSGEPPEPEGDDSDERPPCKPLSDATMSYESLDKFVVSAGGDTDLECKLVLRRRGLGWKVTEFIIPLGKMGGNASSKRPVNQEQHKPDKSAARH